MDKPKTVKTAYISGTFPELPAARAYQEGRGEGSNLRVAAANAIKDLLKKPALRSRRLSGAKLTLAFGFKTIQSEDTNGDTSTRTN
jgi:hypothetical protein